jgi:radical SAM protein with 4Fe4S-binding SPASM domain
MTRPHGLMSDELFHKIIEDGKKFRRPFFVPFLNGESFMFPRIWEWLDYMQKENVPVHLYTNGEYMDVDRLVKYTNIRLICVSVNANTAETHQAVMRGPNFEVVEAKTRDLINKSRCPIYVSMVEIEANQSEKLEFAKKWGKHAIFGEFKNWGGAVHDPLERTGKRVPCWSLMNAITILWDGRVVACCLDYDGQLVIGDANKQSLTEIWHNSKWLRDKHRQLDFSMLPCKDCNQNIL